MFCVLSACDAKLATNGMLSHGQRGVVEVVLLQLHLHICKSLQRRQAMGSACVCVMLHHSCAIVYLVSPNLASMEWVRLSWQEREEEEKGKWEAGVEGAGVGGA